MEIILIGSLSVSANNELLLWSGGLLFSTVNSILSFIFLEKK